MSDTEKNDRPAGETDGDGDAPDRGESPSALASDDDTQSPAKSQDKSLLGSAPKLTPPPRRPMQSRSQKEAKRKSLSARLKQLAAKSGKDRPSDERSSDERSSDDEVNSQDDAPPVDKIPADQNPPSDEPSPQADENRPVDDEEPATDRLESLPFEVTPADEVDEDYGDATDRLESLPFEPQFADKRPTNKRPADGDDEARTTRANQKSTMLMHSVAGPDEAAPEAAESESARSESPDSDAFADEKTALSPGLVDAQEFPESIGEDGDDHDAFEGEKTALSPGLVDAQEFPEPGGDDPGVQAPEPDAFDGEKTALSPGLVDAQEFPDDHEFDEKTVLSSSPEIAGQTSGPAANRERRDPISEPTFDEPFDDLPATSTGLAEDTDNSQPPPPQIGSGPQQPPAGQRKGAAHARAPESSPSPKPQAPEPQDAADLGSGDFEGHDTELFQSPFDNDPICPRLSVLEGPAAGQDFLINRMRNSVGRGTHNSVIVTDLGMSRKHFEIVQQADDSFRVHDLRSVNGTALNGVKIKEADLFHGDRLEAGHSVFQFTIPGDVPVDNRQRRLIPAESTTTAAGQPAPPVAAPAGAKESPDTLDRILLIVTIIAGLLSVALVVFLLFTTLSEEPAETAATAPDLYFQGVEALQNRQWDEAESLFDQSAQLDPDFGEVSAQLARVEDERKSQAIVEAARQSETLAPELITDLRSISRESNYFEDAQSLLSQARNEEAQDLFERAQSAYEDGDLEAGLTALNELMAVAPRHEGAQQLQSAIEEALDEEYEREQQADEESSDESPARQDAAVAAASSAGDAPRPTPPAVADDADDDDFMNPFERDDSESGDDSRPRRPRRAINFTEGFSLYREGNFDAAIDHFDAIADSTSGSVADRARRVADDIGTYRDAINAGISARDSGDFGSAVEHFQQARQTDISVGGDGGFFETEVAQHLAITLADQGLTRLEAEDYSGAYASLERAQAQEVNHRRVRQLLSDLEDQANAFYIRAANQRLSDPDAAADLCHKILTMVPPSSDIHQRARQMLDELN